MSSRHVPTHLHNRVLTRGMTLFESRAYVLRSGLVTVPRPLTAKPCKVFSVIAAYAIIIRPKEGFNGHVV